MASHEDQAEEIVADLLVDRRVHVLSFLSAVRGSAEAPRPRPFSPSCVGPLFERGDQGVLCELLSSPDVADDASQPRDEPGRLYAPDRFDRAVHLGGCCLTPAW